ncbi:MAG: hypothetical protein WBA74_27800, partial [Cyclobacteriaceae bacterium]
MKQSPLFFVAVLSFLSMLCGCEDRVDPDDLLGPYASGSVTAIQNNEPWEANAFMDMEPRLPGHFALLVTRFNTQGFDRENFVFFRI